MATSPITTFTTGLRNPDVIHSFSDKPHSVEHKTFHDPYTEHSKSSTPIISLPTTNLSTPKIMNAIFLVIALSSVTWVPLISIGGGKNKNYTKKLKKLIK